MNIMKGCHGEITKRSNGAILKTVKINANLFTRIFLYFRSLFCEYFPSKKANYVKSYRVEHAFYNNNMDNEIGILLPKIYSSSVDNYNLEYKLQMQDLSIFLKEGSYRNLYSITRIIRELAKFHIHFWNVKLDYEIWHQGTYWLGSKRKSDKDKFYKKFQLAKKNLPLLINLKECDFEIIEKYIHDNENNIKKYYDKSETLIHGDLKLENLFLCDKGVYLIDFQWCGLGCCATDLMYLIFTSLSYEFLNVKKIKVLLKEYCKHQEKVTFEGIYQDFKIAAIDLFKYLICCKWYNITLKTLQKNDDNKKDGYHVRKKEQIESIFKVLIEFANTA